MRAETDVGLVEDIVRIETLLGRLKARAVDQGSARRGSPPEAQSYASYAKAIGVGRLQLQRFVPGSYFSDPAFDMLLDLFVATETGRRRSFKESALASRAPSATAARYIDLMTRDGLVVREPDPEDGRRTLLSLSPAAMSGMRAWLDRVSSIPLRDA